MVPAHSARSAADARKIPRPPLVPDDKPTVSPRSNGAKSLDPSARNATAHASSQETPAVFHSVNRPIASAFPVTGTSRQASTPRPANRPRNHGDPGRTRRNIFRTCFSCHLSNAARSTQRPGPCPARTKFHNNRPNIIRHPPAGNPPLQTFHS